MESNYVCSNSDAIERNGSVYSSSAGKLRYLRIIFMVIAVPVLVISLLLEIVSNAKHKMVSKKKNLQYHSVFIVGSHQYPVSQKGFGKRATNLFWI